MGIGLYRCLRRVVVVALASVGSCALVSPGFGGCAGISGWPCDGCHGNGGLRTYLRQIVAVTLVSPGSCISASPGTGGCVCIFESPVSWRFRDGGSGLYLWGNWRLHSRSRVPACRCRRH